MLFCCVCKKVLPNRYAVGGRCVSPDCDAVFCALHWHAGNHFCLEHGGDVGPAAKPKEKPVNSDMQSVNRDEVAAPPAAAEAAAAAPAQPLRGAKARKVMQDTLKMVAGLGGRAKTLLVSLKKDSSPEAMLATLDERLKANALRREPVAQRMEELYAKIAADKKKFAAAPPARKRIIEIELKNTLSQYKSAEKEYAVLLENEQVLSQLHGAVSEKVAYGLVGINEDTIDDMAADLEDAVDSAEARLDATRDLEKAGRRRDRHGNSDALWDELNGFGDEGDTGADLDSDIDLFPEKGSAVNPLPERREPKQPLDEL